MIIHNKRGIDKAVNDIANTEIAYSLRGFLDAHPHVNRNKLLGYRNKVLRHIMYKFRQLIKD